MLNINPNFENEIIHETINQNGFFPNNERYPLLIYKKIFDFKSHSTKAVQKFLNHNSWKNSWVNGIYDYHHYHSNNHEVLVIYKGTCKVEIGGNNGKIFEIEEGDVMILPAGVSHKKLNSTSDFKCIGAYPFEVDYDMNYGKESEHPQVDDQIQKVNLPKKDPIFGKNGILFKYWK